jgi:hypothetical protein
MYVDWFNRINLEDLAYTQSVAAKENMECGGLVCVAPLLGEGLLA